VADGWHGGWHTSELAILEEVVPADTNWSKQIPELSGKIKISVKLDLNNLTVSVHEAHHPRYGLTNLVALRG
jgi:hypothetical protein